MAFSDNSLHTRRLRSRGEEMARHREGSTLEAALYRAHLLADDRIAEVSACQRLQNLHRYGGGQDFVRVYSEEVYGIPPEQVVGTMGGTKEGYDKEGQGPAGRVGIRMAAATGLAHGTAQEVGGARAGQRQAAHRSGGTTGDAGMDLKRGGKSQNRDLAKPSQR